MLLLPMVLWRLARYTFSNNVACMLCVCLLACLIVSICGGLQGAGKMAACMLLPACLPACLPGYLCPSVEACKVHNLFESWPVCFCLPACESVCLSAWPSVCLSVSVCLSICFPALPLCQAELRQGCRLLVHLSFCWNKRLLELIRAVFCIYNYQKAPQLPLPTQCLSAPMTLKHHTHDVITL